MNDYDDGYYEDRRPKRLEDRVEELEDDVSDLKSQVESLNKIIELLRDMVVSLLYKNEQTELRSYVVEKHKIENDYYAHKIDFNKEIIEFSLNIFDNNSYVLENININFYFYNDNGKDRSIICKNIIVSDKFINVSERSHLFKIIFDSMVDVIDSILHQYIMRYIDDHVVFMTHEEFNDWRPKNSRYEKELEKVFIFSNSKDESGHSEIAKEKLITDNIIKKPRIKKAK
jgi:hypothetical protein